MNKKQMEAQLDSVPVFDDGPRSTLSPSLEEIKMNKEVGQLKQDPEYQKLRLEQDLSWGSSPLE